MQAGQQVLDGVADRTDDARVLIEQGARAVCTGLQQGAGFVQGWTGDRVDEAGQAWKNLPWNK